MSLEFCPLVNAIWIIFHNQTFIWSLLTLGFWARFFSCTSHSSHGITDPGKWICVGWNNKMSIQSLLLAFLMQVDPSKSIESFRGVREARANSKQVLLAAQEQNASVLSAPMKYRGLSLYENYERKLIFRRIVWRNLFKHWRLSFACKEHGLADQQKWYGQ